MKILVIGIDGLEYDLVEKLDLKNLKQENYGKIILPEEFYHKESNVPYTPIVWTTLVTGLKPFEHKQYSMWVYKNKFIERIRQPFGFIKNKRMILEMLGIKPKMIMFKTDKITIFDRCSPSLAVNVPAINLWNKPNKVIMRDLIQNDKFKMALIIAKKYAEDVIKEFLNEVEKGNYVLGMFYINLLDIAGHLCWYRCTDKLVKYYIWTDGIIKKVLDAVPHKISLVISDHGMQGASDRISGCHSKHMFWSLNKSNFKFNSIYEIPNWILKQCNI